MTFPFFRSSGFANVNASERSAAFPLPISHSWKSLRMSSAGGMIRFRDLCLCCFGNVLLSSEANTRMKGTHRPWWRTRVRLLVLCRRRRFGVHGLHDDSGRVEHRVLRIERNTLRTRHAFHQSNHSYGTNTLVPAPTSSGWSCARTLRHSERKPWPSWRTPRICCSV